MNNNYTHRFFKTSIKISDQILSQKLKTSSPNPCAPHKTKIKTSAHFHSVGASSVYTRKQKLTKQHHRKKKKTLIDPTHT